MQQKENDIFHDNKKVSATRSGTFEYTGLDIEPPSLTLPFLLLFLAIFAPFSASQGWFMPPSETLASWVQRSGAIMVLFSIIAGYQVTLSGDDEIKYTFNNRDAANKFVLKNESLKYFGATFMIGGTFLWGYGDLIYK